MTPREVEFQTLSLEYTHYPQIDVTLGTHVDRG